METITTHVSHDQAHAYDTGQKITIKPMVERTFEVTLTDYEKFSRGYPISVTKKRLPKLLIVKFNNGNVFSCTNITLIDDTNTALGRVGLRVEGECRLISKGAHFSEVGEVQGAILGTDYEIILSES